jgi:hypothetical protein
MITNIKYYDDMILVYDVHYYYYKEGGEEMAKADGSPI